MNKSLDTLAVARGHASEAWDRSYPTGFSVAPAWAAHQRQNRSLIQSFASAQEAITFAQDGSQTGFDHRIEERVFASQVSAWKLREISRRYGMPTWAEESGLSSNLKIEDFRVSTIFLTHLYYYLQIDKFVREINTVLEIGGGYGGLARIFKLGKPNCRYILTDLPESLFFAEVFLRENFPHAKIAYGIDAADYDFLLIPVQDIHLLDGKTIDIAINTGSFQEMPEETNRYWMMFLQTKIDLRALYSFNYFFINRTWHGETSAGAATPICPIFDDKWTPLFCSINPAIPTIDATQRNWLEILVRRSGPNDPEQFFAKAQSFPLGTNGFFENVLMALWCKPSRKYVEAFLSGCELFKRGSSFDIQNYRRKPGFKDTLVGAWLIKNGAYLLGRPRLENYIDTVRGRYVGHDVGFMRHNYYFLRALKKALMGPKIRRGAKTNFSEEEFFKRLSEG